MRISTSTLLLMAALGLGVGGCGAGSLTGPSGSGGSAGTGGNPGTGGSPGTGGAAGGSPGSVTFELSIGASGTSFCDEISCSTPSIPHLTILTAAGQPLNWPAPGVCFAVQCDTCERYACPLVCPATQGYAYTGGTETWDGSYGAASTCGASNTTCSLTQYAAPGHYIAKYCATPGTLSQPDGGLATCTATGPAVCDQIPFDYPASAPIAIPLIAQVNTSGSP